MPYRGKVWMNKLYVPPYKLLSAIISSPAFATFKIAKVMAAIPDAVATAAVPSSNKATRFSNVRSEEHTSELQSRFDLVCRLLLEKKNKSNIQLAHHIRNQS